MKSCEVSATLRPVARQYSCAPAPMFDPMKRTRGRSGLRRDLQRGCNGVRGGALQVKSLISLTFTRSATLQRCNGVSARVCGRDATRCGHTYARGTRCAVAALQSSEKRGISIAWAATHFATPAATPVATLQAAPRFGAELASRGARSIKYPRISAGEGRGAAIRGVCCACAARSAPAGAAAAVQALDLVLDRVAAAPAGRIEQNQGLGEGEAVPFACSAFAFFGNVERCQWLGAAQRLTVRAKRRSPAAWGAASRETLPPRSGRTPTPGRPPAPLSASPLAAPVGPDREARLQGRASIGICREPEGPGRVGPRGTGLRVAGLRGGEHG